MKRLAALLMLWCLPASADAPRVVTDIAPVHSLVAMVMEGVGEPVLLMDSSNDPHGGSLRPSQARALRQADLLVWMGEELTPWLKKSSFAITDAAEIAEIESGPGGLSLLDQERTKLLPLREDYDHHDHDHDHHHGEESIDPHAWLDPVNARQWVDGFGTLLGRIDPPNAARYEKNAQDAVVELDALTSEMEEILAPVRTMPFAVDHDAFHYLEDRFELTAVAAHSSGDGDKPGPQRMRTLLARLGEGDVACLFAEPDSSDRMLARLGDEVRVVRLDPLGATLEPGAALYPAMMRMMATDMAACLGR